MTLTGPELKALRRKLKMTQKELAEKLQVAPNTVARWETPTAYPVPYLVALECVRMVKDAEDKAAEEKT